MKMTKLLIIFLTALVCVSCSDKTTQNLEETTKADAITEITTETTIETLVTPESESIVRYETEATIEEPDETEVTTEAIPEEKTETSVETEVTTETIPEVITEATIETLVETLVETMVTAEETPEATMEMPAETVVTTEATEMSIEVSTREGIGIEYIINPEAPLVVIDAGHQGKQNKNKEPIGPGSSEMKTKVTSGTASQWSGLAEYQLTLIVSLKLRDALLNEGYNVIMIRETHDVDISNAERAIIANNANADAFVRIHVNSWTNPSYKGILTISPTANNPYCSEIYSDSRLLSELVVNSMSEVTGGKNRGVMETDTMSGINWCKVPVTIIEMGYMSNKEEAYLMETEDYQNKLVEGMVLGINRFFGY